MAKFEFGFDELWFRMLIKKLPDHPELFSRNELENAQQILRIGKLKVGATRIWAEASGLIQKERGGHILTPLGKSILRFDPEMEEDGVWWIIHYNLARKDSVAWFYSYYINYFEQEEFDRQALESELRVFYAKDRKPLTDDMFHKLVYSPFKQVFESTRFGNGRSSGGFRLFYENPQGGFARDPKGSKPIPPPILGYCLCDWALEKERHTAHIEELLSPGAPGCILRLDRASLDDTLVAIGERYMKKVAWISHTANLNSVAISDVPALALLVTYYLELDGVEPLKALETACEMVESGRFGKWR